MNLLIKKFGAVLLISALFFSCEDPSEVGLSLNPDLQNLKIQFVDIPLEVVNVRFDSINTTNQGRLLVGNIDDPEFGNISATAFTQVRPSFSNPKIPDDAEYMSLKLNVLVNYEYGTNPNSNQKFYIHQLSDTIANGVTYYKQDILPFSPETIGTFNMSFDPANIDTLKVNISNVIGEDFFAKAKDTIVFKSASSFNEYFKGLAIVGDENNSAIIGISSESVETKMVLTYKTSKDTTALEFLFNTKAGNVNLITKNFNNINIDETGMPVEGINQFHKEFIPLDNKVFSQGIAGLYPKVKLDNLRAYIRNNNIVVNRADLIIEEISVFPSVLAPPNSLVFFNTTGNNKFILNKTTKIPKAISQFNNANASLEVPFREEDSPVPFAGNISAYLQSIISENNINIDINEDILLIPKDRYSSINRMSFDKDKVKIRLYYTSFDQ